MSYRYGRSYYVYILANPTRTLYVGVTNNLEARLHQHRRGTMSGFTSRYGIYRLVYCEEYSYINNAIAREKEIKGWLRVKKIALIEAQNPTWRDLSVDWFETDSSLRSE
jgi:putative endonuclease